VVSSGIKWYQVVSNGVKWHQVAPSGDRSHQLASSIRVGLGLVRLGQVRLG